MTLNNYQWQVMRRKPTKVEALSKKIDDLSCSKQVNLIMQCDAIGAGMINLKCFPFKSNVEHEQVKSNMEHEQNNPTTIITIQDRGVIRIFLGVVKEIKGHNPLWGLENSISQVAKLVSERQQGSLPSNTKINPNEQVYAITVLVEPKRKLNLEVVEKNDRVEECKKKHKPMVSEYKPPILYLTKLKKDRINEKYGKFLELLKNLHINLPCVETFS
ncbi:Aspartic peptidase [Gossypium australe]|uniref:Aspartic peptidase n=1 Tax=Gossypium australe TaxID=47621 RepID=A0A5B6UFC3_9ROSI|nr:Aspartic peptidase [Gossypium australe]